MKAENSIYCLLIIIIVIVGYAKNLDSKLYQFYNFNKSLPYNCVFIDDFNGENDNLSLWKLDPNTIQALTVSFRKSYVLTETTQVQILYVSLLNFGGFDIKSQLSGTVFNIFFTNLNFFQIKLLSIRIVIHLCILKMEYFY